MHSVVSFLNDRGIDSRSLALPKLIAVDLTCFCPSDLGIRRHCSALAGSAEKQQDDPQHLAAMATTLGSALNAAAISRPGHAKQKSSFGGLYVPAGTLAALDYNLVLPIWDHTSSSVLLGIREEQYCIGTPSLPSVVDAYCIYNVTSCWWQCGLDIPLVNACTLHFPSTYARTQSCGPVGCLFDNAGRPLIRLPQRLRRIRGKLRTLITAHSRLCALCAGLGSLTKPQIASLRNIICASREVDQLQNGNVRLHLETLDSDLLTSLILSDTTCTFHIRFTAHI